MLRSDMRRPRRAAQLADYLAASGLDSEGRRRLLLPLRRRLDRVEAAGLVQKERVAEGDAVSKDAVIMLQLRSHELLLRVLLLAACSVAPAGSGDAGGEGAAGAGVAGLEPGVWPGMAGPVLQLAPEEREALFVGGLVPRCGGRLSEEQLAAAVSEIAVGLAPMSPPNKNSLIQNTRRNLRRAFEVGMASEAGLKQAEMLLRLASAQAAFMRAGKSLEEAAEAALAAEETEAARQEASAAGIPSPAFWEQAAQGLEAREVAVGALVEQWRPLGPKSRLALRRRIYAWLGR